MPLTTPYERVFYVSDGITAEYSFPFVPISRDFIHVNLKHTDGRIEYDVGVEVPLDKTGEIIGVIAFNKEENKVPKAGTIIMIERRTPLTQDTDYSKQIQFSAKALDYSFDKLQAQLQELTERIDTSVISTNPFQKPITLDVLTEKNHGQYLQFDYDKNALKGGLFFNNNNYFGVSSDGTTWSYYYDTQIIDNKITEIKTYSDEQNAVLESKINEKLTTTNAKLTTLRNDVDNLGDQVSGKQDQLIAGDNIIISGNIISATGAGGGVGFDVIVVQELPESGEKGIIYLVPKDSAAPDIYDEYVWVTTTSTFELIGSTKVDLTDYVKNTDYATTTTGGVIKIDNEYGIGISNGSLTGQTKSLSQYNSFYDSGFIVKGTLENIKYDYVKRGITENTIELSSEEQTAAKEWLGIKNVLPFPILTPIWSDHLLNDVSWLRADTFSWQSGDVYVAAYNHLVDDILVDVYAWSDGSDFYTLTATPSVGDIVYYGTGLSDVYSSEIEAVDGSSITFAHPRTGDTVVATRSEANDGKLPAGWLKQTDTIGDITITYYQAEDGHKIALPDQESNISALYNQTGVAWYFILDTENKQFKLPRTKWGFTGLRDSVGGYVAPGLPNITGQLGLYGTEKGYCTTSGAFTKNSGAMSYGGDHSKGDGLIADFNASNSNAIYGASDTVQPPATQMYLYFYVGNFEQEAVEQTAGLNAELFNGKADLNLSNITNDGRANIANVGMPSGTYTDLTLGSSGTTYTAPADGWFYLQKTAGSAGAYMSLSCGYIVVNQAAPGASNSMAIFIPAKAGKECVLTYSATGTGVFKFIYAEGAKHLA